MSYEREMLILAISKGLAQGGTILCVVSLILMALEFEYYRIVMGMGWASVIMSAMILVAFWLRDLRK